MTLFRMIVVLGGALVVLLLVVILRSESTRLHYDISRLEREAAVYREQLRTAEVELARLRSPVFLRQRVQDALQKLAGEELHPRRGDQEQPQPAGD